MLSVNNYRVPVVFQMLCQRQWKRKKKVYLSGLKQLAAHWSGQTCVTGVRHRQGLQRRMCLRYRPEGRGSFSLELEPGLETSKEGRL